MLFAGLSLIAHGLTEFLTEPEKISSSIQKISEGVGLVSTAVALIGIRFHDPAPSPP
jgi:hypothetical protein